MCLDDNLYGVWEEDGVFRGGEMKYLKAMQYYFYRGFAETDDVMHNTIGCVLGALMVKGSWLMVHGFSKGKRPEVEKGIKLIESRGDER